MTREEKQKAIEALKISAPVMAVTQEEFNDYIQTLNKVMDWLEQEPTTKNEAKYCDRNICLKNEYNNIGCEDCEVTKSQKPAPKNNLGVDAVSRQVISDYVESHIQEINTGYGDLNRHTNSILRMIIDYIENMPSVTPHPRKGHWISRRYVGHDLHFHVCSECNEEFSCDMETGISIDNYRYCPNCGSDNREVEE